MDENHTDSLNTSNQVSLFVGNQYFHHHAFEIISSHSSLKDLFLTALNNKINITPRIKKHKEIESDAIKADDLNKSLRILLKAIPNNQIKFEVIEENGVFYFSAGTGSIGGFDFAILNHSKNILALRNLCFGHLQFANGENIWNSFLKKNPDLVAIANKLETKESFGKDIPKTLNSDSTIPLIVGEIQFGNWALAYRDFFKVLKANVQNNIDCLVYIVPTGELEKKLSDGIVTFDKTKRILQDFEKVISVPVWLIGLDIK